MRGWRDFPLRLLFARLFCDTKALYSLGRNVNVKIYPAAGDAFENPNNKTGYRPQDARNAQARSSHFLAQPLHPSER